MNFEQMALLIALRKLLQQQRHFSICEFDTCLALAGISISAEERRPFNAIHCVDYADMPTEFKKELFERIVVIFKRQPDFAIDIESILNPPQETPTKTGSRLLRIFNH